LLGLFFRPEDGSDMLLRNVGWLSTGYAALYSGTQNSPHIPLNIVFSDIFDKYSSFTEGGHISNPAKLLKAVFFKFLI
jgi:hypothetical protein